MGYPLTPEQRAERVECACGCGAVFPRFRNGDGKPRRFVSIEHWHHVMRTPEGKALVLQGRALGARARERMG